MKKLLGECEVYADSRGVQHSARCLYPTYNYGLDNRKQDTECRLFWMYKNLHAVDDVWKFNKVNRYNNLVG